MSRGQTMKEIQKNSPNHYKGRFGWKSDILVCHQTGGVSVEAALNYYLNAAGQCSPNDVIDINGDIYHLVSYDDAAYCNGTQTTDPNKKLYYKNATSKLVKSRKANANFFTYSVEFVHCAKGDITEAQIQAVIWLLKNRIIPHAKSKGVDFKVDRDHVIGHCEIDPAGRSFCPGKNFPYDRIIKGVLAEEKEYDVTACRYVYQSYGQAAIRTEPIKGDNIVKRCVKGGYYPISGTLELDGVTWLKHADGGYSMLKDGGRLFRRCGYYTLYKTTDLINVRSSAKIAVDNDVGDIAKGTLVYASRTVGEWAEIIHEGKLRYVYKKYLAKGK